MTFDECFALVIGHEGGYVNDPKDPGGETKFGISKRSYPHVDIAGLHLDAAKEIYRRDYWSKAGCQHLPPGLNYAVFDAAVNVGVGRAVRWLQEAVGTVADGVIGTDTRQSIRDLRDVRAAVETINGMRLRHYMRLSSINERFGLGWARRVLRVHLRAVSQEA